MSARHKAHIAKPDLNGDSLSDLYEIGSAVEGLAEILQEFDAARQLCEELPEWCTPRHTATLIAAVKHLAGEAMDEIEVIQARRAGAVAERGQPPAPDGNGGA